MLNSANFFRVVASLHSTFFYILHQMSRWWCRLLVFICFINRSQQRQTWVRKMALEQCCVSYSHSTSHTSSTKMIRICTCQALKLHTALPPPLPPPACPLYGKVAPSSSAGFKITDTQFDFLPEINWLSYSNV